jgi:hypothetical protein
MSLAGFAEIYGNILPAGAPTPSEGLTPPPVGRNLGYDNR